MTQPLSSRPLFAALTGALVCGAASAQIRQPGEPATATANLPADVPTETLQRPDIETLLAEDAAQTEFGPFRYGAVIDTELDFSVLGRWDETASGTFVWRLRIASPGAHTLGVVFDEFELPEGGSVFLYNDDKSHVLGAYNHLTNKPNGQLGVEPLVGDAVTIEYVQEGWVSATPRLRVGEVIHDYKGLYDQAHLWDTAAGTQQAGSCLVDINCPEGAPYQVIKRAVTRGLSGGSTCSASIINNTENDQTPYMLTANHCGSFTNSVMVFNYELPECGSGTAPTTDTVSGTTLLENTSQYDSQLYRLSATPPLDYHVYYAGWDRGTTTVAPAVSISHPQGLPKKLAEDAAGAVSFGTTYWRAIWDFGILLGGSSGSPLFNGNGQVLGPACCVSNFTCGSQAAFYGRLEKFWGSQPIAQYLDPNGTGVTDIPGYDPCPPVATYCTAKMNSCGGVPVLAVDGLPQASETSGLLLTGSGAQPGKAGLALYSPNGRQTPALPFQGGLLCINPQGMRRSAAVASVGGTSGNCDASFEIDWNAFATGNAGGNPAAFLTLPGQQVNLQWWGRDTVANGSYLSDALEYTVCP